MIFGNVLELQELNLSHNKIQKLSAHAFDRLSKLEILSLSYNFITEMDNKQFAALPNLKWLALDNNQIQYIDAHLFTVNKYMELLQLDNNQIDNIDSETFESCSENLKSLYLSNNRLISINASNLLKLTNLNVSRNNFSTIDSIPLLYNLQSLDLSWNSIDDINLSSFSNMTELKELSLRSSGLKTIEFGTFSHQRKLKILDISDNNLEFIDPIMFHSLANINSLMIAANNLSFINLTSIFINMPDLRIIDISDNLWMCQDLSEMLKILHQKNISVETEVSIKSTNNVNGIGCTIEQPMASQPKTPAIEDEINKNIIIQNKTLNILDIALKKLVNSVAIISNRVDELSTEMDTHHNFANNFSTHFIELSQKLTELDKSKLTGKIYYDANLDNKNTLQYVRNELNLFKCLIILIVIFMAAIITVIVFVFYYRKNSIKLIKHVSSGENDSAIINSVEQSLSLV